VTDGAGSEAFDRSVSCEHLAGYQVLVRAKDHSWVVDEPRGVGGDGLAPNPFDMLIAGLGSCTAITVAHLAKKLSTPIEKMWVDVEISSTGRGQARKFNIKVVLRVRGDLDDGDLKRIEGYAEGCPVHRLLSSAALVSIKREVILA
jgi:putative redox protein